jgi:hypothetical protein
MDIKCKCPKCEGLVVADNFQHLFRWLRGLRCVNCGWIKLHT